MSFNSISGLIWIPVDSIWIGIGWVPNYWHRLIIGWLIGGDGTNQNCPQNLWAQIQITLETARNNSQSRSSSTYQNLHNALHNKMSAHKIHFQNKRCDKQMKLDLSRWPNKQTLMMITRNYRNLYSKTASMVQLPNSVSGMLSYGSTIQLSVHNLYGSHHRNHVLLSSVRGQ